jgi:hypothetical protein
VRNRDENLTYARCSRCASELDVPWWGVRRVEQHLGLVRTDTLLRGACRQMMPVWISKAGWVVIPGMPYLSRKEEGGCQVS